MTAISPTAASSNSIVCRPWCRRPDWPVAVDAGGRRGGDPGRGHRSLRLGPGLQLGGERRGRTEVQLLASGGCAGRAEKCSLRASGPGSHRRAPCTRSWWSARCRCPRPVRRGSPTNSWCCRGMPGATASTCCSRPGTSGRSPAGAPMCWPCTLCSISCSGRGALQARKRCRFGASVGTEAAGGCRGISRWPHPRTSPSKLLGHWRPDPGCAYRVALSRRRGGQGVERRWCQPGMLV
jgi:hypothetical protein